MLVRFYPTASYECRNAAPIPKAAIAPSHNAYRLELQFAFNVAYRVN